MARWPTIDVDVEGRWIVGGPGHACYVRDVPAWVTSINLRDDRPGVGDGQDHTYVLRTMRWGDQEAQAFVLADWPEPTAVQGYVLLDLVTAPAPPRGQEPQPMD